MNKELIIEMAQKAGLIDWDWEISAYGNEIKEFARLVAEHERNEIIEILDAIRERGNP